MPKTKQHVTLQYFSGIDDDIFCEISKDYSTEMGININFIVKNITVKLVEKLIKYNTYTKSEI